MIAGVARDLSNRLLSGDFLIREVGRIGPCRGMLDSDRADLSLCIHIQKSVLVKITRFRNGNCAKFNEQSIGVGEVTYFHGTNLRSIQDHHSIWARPNGFKILGGFQQCNITKCAAALK
jgi:hypothetical protein